MIFKESFYGLNVGCLDNFDLVSYPYRVADGLTMSVRSGDARPELTGPRED